MSYLYVTKCLTEFAKGNHTFDTIDGNLSAFMVTKNNLKDNIHAILQSAVYKQCSLSSNIVLVNSKQFSRLYAITYMFVAQKNMNSNLTFQKCIKRL